MKNAAHSVHPEVIERLAALDKTLETIYPSLDFAYSLAVEGQIVATKSTHDDIVPVAWPLDSIALETAARLKKKPVVAEPPAFK